MLTNLVIEEFSIAVPKKNLSHSLSDEPASCPSMGMTIVKLAIQEGAQLAHLNLVIGLWSKLTFRNIQVV